MHTPAFLITSIGKGLIPEKLRTATAEAAQPLTVLTHPLPQIPRRQETGDMNWRQAFRTPPVAS